MTKRAYIASCLLILAFVFAFPVFQIFKTNGLLFYTNGWDEASYLQYDYAKHVLEIAGGGRAAQYLVILLHDIGLSGGWINFFFDLLTCIALFYSLPLVFIYLGFNKEKSRMAAISFLGLPLIFSNFNGLYAYIQNLNMRSDAVRWISMPFINDPFWLRTPEPQLTLLLLFPGYPFLLVPLIFIGAAVFFERKFKFDENLSLIFSAVVVSLLLLIYRLNFPTPVIGGYIVPTNLPLISFSGTAGLILYYLPGKREMRVSKLLLASIWFSLNFQIISGFTIQPNNFEQYWGVIALVLIALLQTRDINLGKALCCLSLVLLAGWSFINFKINNSFLERADLNPEFLKTVQDNASKAYIPDIYLSTRLDMLFPKQKPLLLSYTRFYKNLPEYFLKDFLCAKEELLKDPRFRPIIAEALEFYKNGDQNYILNTIGRINHPLPERKFEIDLKSCAIS